MNASCHRDGETTGELLFLLRLKNVIDALTDVVAMTDVGRKAIKAS